MKKTATIIVLVLFIFIFIFIYLLLSFNSSFREGLAPPIVTIDYNFITNKLLPNINDIIMPLTRGNYIDYVVLTYDSSSKSNITFQNITVNINNKVSLLDINRYINSIFKNLIKVDIILTKKEKKLSDITFQQKNSNGTKYYGVSIQDYLTYFNKFLKNGNVIIKSPININNIPNETTILNKYLIIENITFTLNNTLFNLSTFIDKNPNMFIKNSRIQNNIANSICYIVNFFLTIYNSFNITYDPTKVSSLIMPTPIPTTTVPRTHVHRSHVPRSHVPRSYVPRTPVPRTPVPRTPVPRITAQTITVPRITAQTITVPKTPVPTTPVPTRTVSYTLDSLMSYLLN